MRRDAKNVILSLLDAAGKIRYPAGVKPISSTLEKLLSGFSPFPFGWGLLRTGNTWPEYFPDSPHLVLLHNWGNEKMLQEAHNAGGEAGAVWWSKRLRPILEKRSIDLNLCFFSNALMGLKEGDRCGDEPFDQDYRTDCRNFLCFQLERVNPRSVIHCGTPCDRGCTEAYANLRSWPPCYSTIMHPASRRVNWGGLAVEEWIKREASKIL